MLLEGAKFLRGHCLQGKRGRRHQRICECSSNPHRRGFSPAASHSVSLLLLDSEQRPATLLLTRGHSYRAVFRPCERLPVVQTWVRSVHENSTRHLNDHILR